MAGSSGPVINRVAPERPVNHQVRRTAAQRQVSSARNIIPGARTSLDRVSALYSAEGITGIARGGMAYASGKTESIIGHANIAYERASELLGENGALGRVMPGAEKISARLTEELDLLRSWGPFRGTGKFLMGEEEGAAKTYLLIGGTLVTLAFLANAAIIPTGVFLAAGGLVVGGLLVRGGMTSPVFREALRRTPWSAFAGASALVAVGTVAFGNGGTLLSHAAGYGTLFGLSAMKAMVHWGGEKVREWRIETVETFQKRATAIDKAREKLFKAEEEFTTLKQKKGRHDAETVAKAREVENKRAEVAHLMREQLVIKKANQKKVALAQTSRMLGVLYMGVLSLCFLAKGFDLFSSIDYTLVFVSQVYYTLGAAVYSRLEEGNEYAELSRDPAEEVDPTKRLSKTVNRYSNKGTMRPKQRVVEYTWSDLYNYIAHFGKKYVLFHNDSRNNFTFDARGAAVLADRIMARTAAIEDAIASRIPSLNAAPHIADPKAAGNANRVQAEITKRKRLFSFILSSIEVSVTSNMALVDDAVNEVYPDCTPHGENVRFRDSLSHDSRLQPHQGGQGEVVVGRALQATVIAGLDVAAREDTRLKDIRKGKFASALLEWAMRRNGLDLNNVTDQEAVARVCEEASNVCGLTSTQRTAITEFVQQRLMAHLELELCRAAEKAGMDADRSEMVARIAVNKLQTYDRWKRIAEIGERMLTGRSLLDRNWDVTELTNLLIETFHLEHREAEWAARELFSSGPVLDRAARKMAGEPVEASDATVYGLRDYFTLVAAFDIKGIKSEERNLLNVWRHIVSTIETHGIDALTPGQKGIYRTACTGAAENARRKGKTVAPGSEMQLAEEWFYGQLNKGNSPIHELMQRQIEQDLSEAEIFGGKKSKGKSAKQRNKLARILGIQIARRAAPHQVFAGDYLAECEILGETRKNVSREAAEARVRDRFERKLEEIVDEIVTDELLREYGINPKKPEGQNERARIIEIAAEAAKEEFRSGHNMPERMELGLSSFVHRENTGLREVAEELESNGRVAQAVDAQFGRMRQARQDWSQRVDRLAGFLSQPGDTPEVQAAAREYANGLAGKLRELANQVVGDRRTYKGWLMSFEEMRDALPATVLGQRDLHFAGYLLKSRKENKQYTPKELRSAIKGEQDPAKKAVLERMLMLVTNAEGNKQLIQNLNSLIDAQAERPRARLQLTDAIIEVRNQEAEQDNSANPIKNTSAVYEDLAVLLGHLAEVAANPKRKTVANARTPQAVIESEAARAPNDAGAAWLAEFINNNSAAMLQRLIEYETADYSGTSVNDPGKPIKPFYGIDAARLQPMEALCAPTSTGASPLAAGADAVAHAANKRRQRPFIYYRAPRREWLLGKAVNTNGILTPYRHGTQMATIIRNVLGRVAEEHEGLWRVPMTLHKKADVNVVDQLRFTSSTTEDFDVKLKNHLLPDDIVREMAVLMYHEGKSATEAADVIFGRINAAMTPEGKRLTRKLSRVNRLGQIRKNLILLAEDIQVCTFGYAVSATINNAEEGVAQGLSSARSAIGQIPSASFSVKRKLRAIASEEAEYANVHGQNIINAARFRGAPRTTERGRTESYDVMELMLTRGRTIDEAMEWLKTIQGAPQIFIEEGTAKADGALLDEVGRIGQELYPEYGRTSGRDNLRYIDEFDKAAREWADNAQESFAAGIGRRLQETEDTQRDFCGGVIENVLDTNRFRPSEMEQMGTDIQMNADTDNYFYESIATAAGAFGGHNGVKSFRGKIIQFGLNYDDPAHAPFSTMQRDRDLGLPQNKADIASKGIDDRTTVQRWERSRHLATLTGYANLASIDDAIETVDFVVQPNVENTAYSIQNWGWWNRNFGGNFIALDETLRGRVKSDWHSTENALKKPLLAARGAYRWGRTGVLGFVGITNKDIVSGKGGIKTRGTSTLGHRNGLEAYLAVCRWSTYGLVGTAAAATLGSVFTAAMGFGALTLAPMFVPVLGIAAGAYVLTNHVPRIFGRPKLTQYFAGRRWYHLHPSEDLATTVSLNKIGGRVIQRKGLRQMNDCMVELLGDLAQKIRWQAFNSHLLRTFGEMFQDHPHMLNYLQKLDLMLGPLYNTYSFPALLYRLGIAGFVFGNVFAMMMPDPQLQSLSIGSPLGLIMEMGLINYTVIELMIRYGRYVNGSPFGRATSDNFAYDSMYMWFNYSQVSLRLISNLRAGFNVTDPPEQNVRIPMSVGFREKVNETERVFRSFMRMNWDVVALDLTAAAVVAKSYVLESGVMGEFDLMAIGMGMLIPWSLRTAYYTTKGMWKLNAGIMSVDHSKKMIEKDIERIEKEEQAAAVPDAS
ncbi:MAG: hypothetical protein KKB81_07730 [Candidatus Margulisbacteria bacterium]|nr:hypothetical protein [Candidatus Margulisiibacteriota bacterium]MBU1021238.1 hypothetical protein [Candidatus Margulisiibacteriota bacterium]MBU1729844.1 hypothetical protein [Candidatus Margulisiibacteriota bacterium]MBU1955345.1 hypothetical protein [Candidatus Margulisiibacteriota bacterium]